MISPDFTCATGMKMFMLEQPIVLQLTCIRSRSTINHGTRATIKFGDHKVYSTFLVGVSITETCSHLLRAQYTELN